LILPDGYYDFSEEQQNKLSVGNSGGKIDCDE
jgi:hypothetical protein